MCLLRVHPHWSMKNWIWFLNKSIDHTKWTLTHEIDLKPLLGNFPWKHGHRSWFGQGVKVCVSPMCGSHQVLSINGALYSFWVQFFSLTLWECPTLSRGSLKKNRNWNGFHTTMMPQLQLLLRAVFRKSSKYISFFLWNGHKYISSILGFHPYKEIVFLHMPHPGVVAYQVSTSKVDDLGSLVENEPLAWTI